jgi:hypothetical protein
MEKTIAIQIKELLTKIEDEIIYMKPSDNRCCLQYQREILDVIDFEKSKIK